MNVGEVDAHPAPAGGVLRKQRGGREPVAFGPPSQGGAGQSGSGCVPAVQGRTLFAPRVFALNLAKIIKA